MVTYPNQKIIHINKGEYTQNYLTVGIDEWIEASKVLKPNTFKVYLYLCSNANGFDLALSRQDIINKLGISLDSYKRAIKELTDKKYIELKQGNVYDFYTMPSMVAQKQPLNNIGSIEAPSMGAYKQPLQVHTSNHNECIEAPSMVAQMPPEINKKNNINNLSNISKDADAKKERDFYNNEKELEDLSNNELYNMLDDFKDRIKYIDLAKKYNVKISCLNNKLTDNINSIINQRKNKTEEEERVDKSNKALQEWNINIEDAQKLTGYVCGSTVDFYDVIWNDIESYKESFYGTGMNPNELLQFLENNEMATYDFYDEHIRSRLEKHYRYYTTYLIDYIKDTENTIDYAKHIILQEEGKRKIISNSNNNTDNSYMDDIWAEMGL